MNANQVFSWRKRYRDAPAAPTDPPASQLIPVVITGESDRSPIRRRLISDTKM